MSPPASKNIQDKDPSLFSELLKNPDTLQVKNEIDPFDATTFKIKKTPFKKPESILTKKRTDVIKWNGWGYNDSKFVVKDGVISFTGNRYPIGEIDLPHLTQWAKETLNIDPSNGNPPPEHPPIDKLPEPVLNKNFLKEIKKNNLDYSIDPMDRLVRSHGQTLHDIYILRKKIDELTRLPDIVVWPASHEEVVKLVQLANAHEVVIIPYGGGTSVSGAITCPDKEERCICSLDTSQMNNILWLDEKNLLICCQSGLIGQDLEKFLNNKGFTCGHEPDSYEFSTPTFQSFQPSSKNPYQFLAALNPEERLSITTPGQELVGGWVATRASGMKKNVYGNIEDLLVGFQFVTPQGVLNKIGLHPRQSTGPDLTHIVLGSEGTLGVVTEVVLKIRPVAPCKKYGSIVFPYFEAGINCMREVAKQRCQPASIRLMDNTQFQFGQALRPANNSYWNSFMENVKKKYLTLIKGYNLKHMSVATLLFEGDKDRVEQQEKLVYKIAKEFGGMPAGEQNGERGYILTFVIAYIRDLGLDFNIVAESFETSVPWDRTYTVCVNVKYVIDVQCKLFGIKYYLISHRVTQTYDCGSCVYFYFAFNWEGLKDPLAAYTSIEEASRAEILKCGGSLSHHHGVGKLRAKWYATQVSQLGASVYSNTKSFLDPKNIFAAGNLLPLKSNL